MCGFSGYFSSQPPSFDPVKVLGQMGDSIRHRGPDDQGIWTSQDNSCGFVHRRLAIVDLSASGHQPMSSSCGRYTIVFNGEIYNHLDIRRSLEASSGTFISWRGSSDTETLLESISRLGLDETLTLLVGMFTFAVWDRVGQTLTLARDRMGEKPLYYGLFKGTLVFGSELHALLRHPQVDRQIDTEVLPLYFERGHIPAPYSILRGVTKLLAGSQVTVSASELISGLPAPKRYWSLKALALQAHHAGHDAIEMAEAADLTERALANAIREQSVADVPLGAFLSGGVDSSLIAALMQVQSSTRVKTFTIGFDHADFNEAAHASAVARHLGTDHHELFVSGKDALAAVPVMGEVYDEPFADASQIPTWLVCKAARQHVTVALSGDGGDELFGGYNRHLGAAGAWRKLSKVPFWARAASSAAMRRIGPERIGRAYGQVQRFMPSKFHMSQPVDKVQKIIQILDAMDVPELHARLTSYWPRGTGPVCGSPAAVHDIQGALEGLHPLPALEWMLLTDALTYLPDDVLVKVDRAAMNVSLETRAPFLDHRVVELAFGLHGHLKVQAGVGKAVVREVLYRHVPKALIDRPKAGFSPPIAAWLRGPLRAWAGDLLSHARISRDGYLDADVIQRQWTAHVQGVADHHRTLWPVLMFQVWLDQFHAIK